MRISKLTSGSARRRFKSNFFLWLRWKFKRGGQKEKKSLHETDVSGLDLCDIYCINLDHRKDRLKEISDQFINIGIDKWHRLPAVKDDNGALGCARSHKNVYEQWAVMPNRLLMVCEDDCNFQIDRSHLDKIINEFAKNSKLDVLCLGYNAYNGIKISEKLQITSNTRTTSCYILKPYIINEFIEMANKSISLLENGASRPIGAIDMVWRYLQTEYFFAISTERAVVQSDSFSDIEQLYVNYKV